MNYLEIEKEMTKTYNGIAKKYEQEAKNDWNDKKEVDKFLSHLKLNDYILDIGCGTGELLKYYNDKKFKISGIDISDEMIKISEQKVPNANIKKTSIYEVDKLNEKFDAISMTYLLVHIPKDNIKDVMLKISRVLKNEGIIFIVFTTKLKEGLQVEPLDSNYKYYAINYSLDEVRDILLSTGFHILQSQEKVNDNKHNIGIIIAKKDAKNSKTL